MLRHVRETFCSCCSSNESSPSNGKGHDDININKLGDIKPISTTESDCQVDEKDILLSTENLSEHAEGLNHKKLVQKHGYGGSNNLLTCEETVDTSSKPYFEEKSDKPSHRGIYGGEGTQLKPLNWDFSDRANQPSDKVTYGGTSNDIDGPSNDIKPSHRGIYSGGSSNDNLNEKPSYAGIYGGTSGDLSEAEKHSKPSHRALYGGGSKQLLEEKSSSLVVINSEVSKPSHKGIYGGQSNEVTVPESSTDVKPSHTEIYGGQRTNLVLPKQIDSDVNGQKPTNKSKPHLEEKSDKPSHRGIYGGEGPQLKPLNWDFSDRANQPGGTSHCLTEPTNDIKPTHRALYGSGTTLLKLDGSSNSKDTTFTYRDINAESSQHNILTQTGDSGNFFLASDLNVSPTRPFAPDTPKPSHRDIYLKEPVPDSETKLRSILSSYLRASSSKSSMDRQWSKPTDYSNVNVVQPQQVNEAEAELNSYQRNLCKINQENLDQCYTGSAILRWKAKGTEELGDNVAEHNPCGSLYREKSYMNSKEVEDGTKVFTLLQSSCKGDINTLKRHYHDGTDMSIADYDGRRALHLAAAEGHLDCVKFLIETCSVPHSPRDRWFHTPLDEAKSFKQEVVAQYLEDYIFRTEEQERGAKTYMLLNSACKGDFKTLKRLFQDGVDMSIADYDGRTALHLCAAEGNLDCVKFLIETCEVQHSPKDRWFHTPLDEAKNAKHEVVVEYLEDYIARANEKNVGAEVYSILNSACKGDVKSLHKMAHDGMDMETADYDGRTALHLAAAEGHAEVVKFLVEKCKVSTGPKDRWQHTPLDEAKNNKNDSVIKYLERCLPNKPKT